MSCRLNSFFKGGYIADYSGATKGDTRSSLIWSLSETHQNPYLIPTYPPGPRQGPMLSQRAQGMAMSGYGYAPFFSELPGEVLQHPGRIFLGLGW